MQAFLKQAPLKQTPVQQSPVRFLFDNDFAAHAASAHMPAADGAVATADIAQRMAEAEQRSYARGFTDAQQAAEASIKAREIEAQERIAQALTTCAKDIPREMETIIEEALSVALAAARKLAPALMAQQPLSEITALLDDCLKHRRTTPHLVIRVSTELPDDAAAHLENAVKTLADQHGFAGRIAIRHEPGLNHGDCGIDWAEGGIIRSREATDAAITALIDNYLAGRHAPPSETLAQEQAQEQAQELAQDLAQGHAP